MGAHLERFIAGSESQIEVLGPGGRQEFETQDGKRVGVSGLWDAAEISQEGQLIRLVPTGASVEIDLKDQSRLKISASYDQPDE